jgi:hypothetical protein
MPLAFLTNRQIKARRSVRASRLRQVAAYRAKIGRW